VLSLANRNSSAYLNIPTMEGKT